MNRISRGEAVERASAERGSAPCLVCAILGGSAGRVFPVLRGDRATVVLARYALRPGHLLVLAHRHATRFQDLPPAEWIEMAGLAHRAARALEREVDAARCYVASLGADSPEAPMSSPHLHLHVVPLASPDEKPSAVLTWSEGVYVDTPENWSALQARLEAALALT